METVIERMELLLLVAVIVSMAARRLRLPYTVGLVFAGAGLFAITGAQPLQLTRDLIFTALLPPLIFEAAFQLDWNKLRRELPVVGVLATIGVLISASVVAAGMHYFLAWSWPSSVLVAVMLSATDPVAVIASFKDLRVKGRVQLLVESESLFNDGTAAVLFAIAVAAATGREHSARDVALSFLLTTVGGIVCGAVVGGASLLIAGRTEDHLVEIAFTTIVAYGSFLLAEHFHLSGVLATLTAGVLLGNPGKLGTLTDKGRESIDSFWEYIAFLANSIIFLLIGSHLVLSELGVVWVPLLAAIGLLFVGRASAVYGCCAAFARSQLAVPARYQHVLFWGGLRGALALALALGLPPDFENRQEILSITFGVVAFSIVVQGITMPLLLSRLGIRGEKRMPT